jgi:hypothetical protein
MYGVKPLYKRKEDCPSQQPNEKACPDADIDLGNKTLAIEEKAN